MNTFDKARTKLNMIGVVLYHPKQKYLFYSGKMKTLVPMIFGFISLAIYLFDGANNFKEYINTIFFLSVQSTCILAVTHCIWNSNSIYGLLADFENTIDSSKKLKHKL